MEEAHSIIMSLMLTISLASYCRFLILFPALSPDVRYARPTMNFACVTRSRLWYRTNSEARNVTGDAFKF
ncbi:hypothetical protein HBI56_095050 [Parastagonospora nodorum]|nr:hypothetical protein HBH53_142080 [Parastagonospora nodorum]KAH3966231.1 hypothetical protein HBH51_143280 [Parastagonospora nodorum]KAH3989589.1 hypothetical protein HBH52_018280 [Parastagonospora nodorum]KAH3998292.1 hypothetical protein HBI10_131170 [Parastagonospora nodorum]KAH4030067.1 hypothetical protein HBI13_036430 [Parastagonospora nodorum]